MNDEKILEEGCTVGSGTGAFYKDAEVVSYNGSLYPFRDGKMFNPLDPMNLLTCLGDLGDDDGAEAMAVARQICETLREATELRKIGFDIVTKYKSGATKVILQHATDNVIILGELAKQKGLILPILSVQLSDGEYDQSSIDVWKERGFTTPPKYSVTLETGSYNYDDYNEYGPRHVDRELTNYHIGDYIISFIHEEGEEAEVSDDEDRDWDYVGFDRELWYVFKDVPERIPQKTERPKYVWQDKGVDDEG